MAAAQVGQPGTLVTTGTQGDTTKAAVIENVVNATTVDIFKLAGMSFDTGVAYVQIGETPPAGVKYFQEIALA